MTPPTALPAHIATDTRTYTIYVCTVCGARMRPGQYANPSYSQQVLDEWITRHRHGVTEEHDTGQEPT